MNYYKQVESLIKNNEINKKVRALQDNSETLYTYWNIGKLIVEAQGGEKRAKYGDGLIKEWGKKLSEKYGRGYDYTNLSRMRTLYITFPIIGTLSQQLSWSHYYTILPIKNPNERNYYINRVILDNLSVRDLKRDKTIDKINEKAIHKYIISLLENKFLELGTGFALVGHEYKIVISNNTYHIDLLFYNYKLNAFIVVEVKTRAVKPQDIGQLQFYVSYIENNLKDNNHNKTIGILIVKKKINMSLNTQQVRIFMLQPIC